MIMFTERQLEVIHDMMEINGGWVRPAYRWYHNMTETADVYTNDVENWVIEFYTAYNKVCPNTY